MTPFEETIRRQQSAADPAISAFVVANAGSGKTRVLVDRVTRLLLAGADPSKILCITFTKAAAAEMAERLFGRLGQWTIAPEKDLKDLVFDAIGVRLASRSDANNARRLFARALETPGGLRIQTIHSFCEQILRRFPLEAGIAPGFTTLEEKDAIALAGRAFDGVVAQSRSDPAIKHDTMRLLNALNAKDFRELLVSGATNRHAWIESLAQKNDIEQSLDALAVHFGGADEETPLEQYLAQLDVGKMQRAHEVFSEAGGDPTKLLAPPIQRFLTAAMQKDRFDALFLLFLTGGGTRRAKLGTAKTDAIAPDLSEYLYTQQTIYEHAVTQQRNAADYQNTAAYIRLQMKVIRQYSNFKKVTALLDYDDLVNVANRLLASHPADWVMYKLDQGIDHILLDEAQDTSPAQWSIIDHPLDEFFSGQSTHPGHRTFFAVGDKKQSIYSFQGADVGLFTQKEHALGKRIATHWPFKNVALELSFRTTAPVLRFVDALFDDRDAAEGLGEAQISHSLHREGEGGRVELWPLTPKQETGDAMPWTAAVDTAPPNHPTTELCAEIARRISTWLTASKVLPSAGRAIAPSDIMILVQSRGRLFQCMLRALAEFGVPTAGADKLNLLEEPVIEDLLSVARFALTPDDDLSLAETLKCPLFGLDDDDLFSLAYDRGDQSLWSNLQQKAGANKELLGLQSALEDAVTLARNAGPYEFFSAIMDRGEPSGRRRFFERLGLNCRDAIDELLRQAINYELSAPKNLTGFLYRFERMAGEIKREPDRDIDAVRVMTVHGAKGLEANIVFLLDAHRPPNLQQARPVFSLGPAAPGHIGFSANRISDGDILSAARSADRNAHFEEYRRLLYVAATRARDELYICGVESGRGRQTEKPTLEKSWYALAEAAFERLDDVNTTDEIWDEPVRAIERPQTKPVPQTETAKRHAPTAPPDWLFRDAPMAPTPVRRAPSKIIDAGAKMARAQTAYSPLEGSSYFRGNLMHKLLERLPAVARPDRRRTADQFLSRNASDIDIAERNRWRDEVLAVIESPDFARIFDSAARAEVRISGTLATQTGETQISGQIDRLSVSAEDVLIVDFKTNRPPPRESNDIPGDYILQMAAYRALLQKIYPDHSIRAAILWTFTAQMMEISSDALDHAFARTFKPA